jgi:hypothetical protein
MKRKLLAVLVIGLVIAGVGALWHHLAGAKQTKTPDAAEAEAIEVRCRWAVEELDRRYFDIVEKSAQEAVLCRGDIDWLKSKLAEAEAAPAGSRQKSFATVAANSRSALETVSRIISKERRQAPNTVMFLVDVSGSMMSWLESEKHQPLFPIDVNRTRAHKARLTVEHRFKELQKVRPDLQYGLCLFDEHLYYVCSIGSDISAFSEQLPRIETTNLYRGGTDLYQRPLLSPCEEPLILRAARHLLMDRPKRIENRLLVVVTDEDIDMARAVDVQDAKDKLKELGVAVEVHKIR